MKRALGVLLIAACTLDPVGGVLNRADLYVRAFNLPPGGKLHLTTIDSTSAAKMKQTPVLKETMDILYEQGTLAVGEVSISAELFDADGALIGCGTARGVVGQEERVLIGFSSPDTSALNCGSCGNRCETDVATGVCIGGRCTGWECPPGLLPQADGGCEEPVVVVPDAGPMEDAGVPDSGTPDAGTMDAGMMCVPSVENSEATCTDGADNNCDLRTDCADPGCGGLTRACSLGVCARMGTQTWNCLTRTWGACIGDVGPEATTTTCKDGVDNDCDGMTDCGDSDCNGIKLACNGGLDICAAGVKLWNCNSGLLDALCLPYIPLPENSNLLCGNDLDDDCDGKIDCLDNLCRGRSCGSQGRVCCADGGCSASCQ